MTITKLRVIRTLALAVMSFWAVRAGTSRDLFHFFLWMALSCFGAICFGTASERIGGLMATATTTIRFSPLHIGTGATEFLQKHPYMEPYQKPATRRGDQGQGDAGRHRLVQEQDLGPADAERGMSAAARSDTKWSEMPRLGSPEFEHWLKAQETQPCFDCLLEASRLVLTSEASGCAELRPGLEYAAVVLERVAYIAHAKNLQAKLDKTAP